MKGSPVRVRVSALEKSLEMGRLRRKTGRPKPASANIFANRRVGGSLGLDEVERLGAVAEDRKVAPVGPQLGLGAKQVRRTISRRPA